MTTPNMGYTWCLLVDKLGPSGPLLYTSCARYVYSERIDTYKAYLFSKDKCVCANYHSLITDDDQHGGYPVTLMNLTCEQIKFFERLASNPPTPLYLRDESKRLYFIRQPQMDHCPFHKEETFEEARRNVLSIMNSI